MTVSYKTSKKLLEKSLQQNNGVWDQLFLQNGPWSLPGRSQSLPRQPLGAQRRLQAASVTSLWLPQAPLVSLWVPLGTA